MALILGPSEEPTRFILLWQKITWIFWISYFVVAIIIGGGLLNNFSTQVDTYTTPEMQQEFQQNTKNSWSYWFEMGKQFQESYSAWTDCYAKFPKDCTKWERVKSGESQEEIVTPTGEELEITPTEVKVSMGTTGEAFTNNYVHDVGIAIEVEVIKGNDDVAIDIYGACNFSNSTWTGYTDYDLTEDLRHLRVPKDTMRGSISKTFLCKSPILLGKGKYEFSGLVKFNQQARSYLKMYFVSEKVPDMDGQEFPFKKVIPAKMESGTVQLDLTTKTASPIKVCVTDCPEGTTKEMGLRVGFKNNEDGKILNVLHQPEIIFPDHIQQLGSLPSISEINKIFEVQQRMINMPFFHIPLIIDSDNMFSETNNPIDEVIQMDVDYTYQFENKKYIMVIT